MTEVEVTVRMPRDVFDEAVAKLREWDRSAEGERRWAQENASDYPLDAAHCLFRAAMLEHTPPWEPTEEQVTAYCERRGMGPDDPFARRAARADLIAAHAVFCEGDR